MIIEVKSARTHRKVINILLLLLVMSLFLSLSRMLFFERPFIYKIVKWGRIRVPSVALSSVL